jgi:mannose-1-phosphate guanylyltransferase
VVGAGCHVGPDARVDGSVLFDGADVGAGAVVSSSTLGRAARIGEGVVLDGVVIGDGARIGPGNELARGLRVWPGVELGPTAIRFSTDA